MKCVAKIGVLFVISVLAATPLLACIVPGIATTEEEAACCREMASECDHGSMPSSHSCCKMLSVADQAAAAKASFQLLHQFSSLYVVRSSFDSTWDTIRESDRAVITGNSLPESPPTSSAILRI